MKFLFKGKDGGPESNTTGYWLVEDKTRFSIVLLKFSGKSREAYHSHAFNCINWVLSGELIETLWKGASKRYLPSWKPFYIYRNVCHKVDVEKDSWVFSIRGPWFNTWYEQRPDKKVTLTSGRKECLA